MGRQAGCSFHFFFLRGIRTLVERGFFVHKVIADTPGTGHHRHSERGRGDTRKFSLFFTRFLSTGRAFLFFFRSLLWAFFPHRGRQFCCGQGVIFMGEFWGESHVNAVNVKTNNLSRLPTRFYNRIDCFYLSPNNYALQMFMFKLSLCSSDQCKISYFNF